MKRLMLLTALVLTAFAACRKDSIFTEISTTDVPLPIEYVQTSIGGTVIDEQNHPVADAKIFLAGKETKTDKNGIFLFKNIVVNSKAAYVRVERDGFFHGSRTILVSGGTRNTVRIQLLAKNDSRQFNAQSGGKADFSNFSITLPANAVVNSSGEQHTGVVDVVAKWLDPTAENFSIQMPGNLRGVTLDGDISGMVSMGMLAVELLDIDGRKLQVKKGQEASIRMRVPDAILSKAPATIPLWYFDEVKGIWREEGEARLVGNFYEGKVSHFSFWNHDFKEPLVEVKFTVLNQQGNPVPNAHIVASLPNGGGAGHGLTDNMGCVLGLIPKDYVLNIKIYSQSQGCNDPLLSTQIGPFSQNGSHTFTINSPSIFTYTITGKLIDCAGNAVINGYAQVDTSGTPAWTDANGDFSMTIIRCTSLDQVEVVGFDILNLKQSEPKLVTLVNNSTVDAGTIQVCDALQEFLTYNWPGNTMTHPSVVCSAVDTIPGGEIDQIYIYTGNGPGLYVGLTLKDVVGLGTYPAQSFNTEGSWNGNVVYHNCPQSNWNCVTVNITEFNGINGYISGTFSGTAQDNQTNPPNPIAVSGSFRGKLK